MKISRSSTERHIAFTVGSRLFSTATGYGNFVVTGETVFRSTPPTSSLVNTAFYLYVYVYSNDRLLIRSSNTLYISQPVDENDNFEILIFQLTRVITISNFTDNLDECK